MKYTQSPKYTTAEESISETLAEINDVIAIARTAIDSGDKKMAITNLDAATNYIEHIKHKVEIALLHVPEDIKQANFL